jgi:hypothetical protein
MFEGFRFRVGTWYAGIRFRQREQTALRFNDIISRARRVLVVFPESSIDWESTQTLLKYLTRRFASGSMLIIVRQELVSNVLSTPNVKTLAYTQQEINGWFLPRASLIQKVRTQSFDAAIDLNVNFALPSAVLCRESHAPLRISFTKDHGDVFYNFQVQVRRGSSSAVAYRSLLKCLDMF